MTWRYGPLWARVYPGVVSCGLRPLVKMSWFRVGHDVYVGVRGRSWQLWPPRPRISGGRLR